MKTAYVLIIACSLLALTACGSRDPISPKQDTAIQNFLRIRWQQLDLDQNHHLDYVEFCGAPIAAKSPNPNMLFNSIDTNGDEYISPAEAYRKAREMLTPPDGIERTPFK